MKNSTWRNLVPGFLAYFVIVLSTVMAVSCGGGGGSDSVLLPAMSTVEKVTPVSEMEFASPEAEDRYFENLEKSLNEKLNAPSGSPEKAAATGLTSITLSQTTDEIMTAGTYDLAKIVVIANVVNEQPKTVTPVWALYSGAGVLSGTVYTAPARYENPVFTATYAENGVSKLAIFRLKVTGLGSVALSKTTDEVNIPAVYNLASEIIVTAKYSNGTTKNVTNDPNLSWVLTTGTGILDKTLYTVPQKAETAVLTVSYVEAGITKTAQFRLKVTGLSSLLLSKTTDEIKLPATYNLDANIAVTAKLTNGTTKIVSPTWMLTSGSGTINGGVYTPAAKVETAVFTASYNDSGIVKTAQFRLKVTGLSSLSLNKTTDEVESCGQYDLSANITGTALFSDGAIKPADNLTWTLVSGYGTLSGPVYTAPNRSETAVIKASYLDAGIEKTVQFRLTVIALSSITLNKTTDEIQLPATYDLASEVIATVKSSNGSVKTISPVWTLASGSGALAGTLYTPSPKVETAVFTAAYTENGITRATQFRLKVIGLSSLYLNKTTDEVYSCSTYDISSNVIISDKLSNGTTKNISADPGTTWALTSGGGSFDGKVYTAPAKAETAVFTANYSEAGIAKSIQFRLRVTALASLSLSKTTDEAQVLSQYDLTTNEIITAKFSNGQTKEVTLNPNTKWTLSFGSGTVNGTIYNTPERIETAIVTATYSEFGVAQSAQFRLKVSATKPGTKVQLVGLSINKTTDSVELGRIYDLSKLAAIAKYSNNTTCEVTLSWIVTSGSGLISGNIFTAPSNAATVRLMGSFTAGDGSIKSVCITLTVFGKEIYGNSGTVTKAGVKFHLTNGIAVEIPPNSVEESFNINFELNKSYGDFNVLPGQTIFSCNFAKEVKEIRLTMPAKPDMNGVDYTMTCIMPDIDEVLWQDSIIRDSLAIFLVSSIFMPGNGLPPPDRSPSWDTTGDKEVRGQTTFIIYCDDEIAQKSFSSGISNKKIELPALRWPFYLQYKDTCWAATWLMLMKGYSNNLSKEFDSIYKIFKVVKERGVVNGNLKFDDLGGLIHAGLKANGGFSNKKDILLSLERARVVQLTNEFNKMTIKAYYCDNINALINFIVNRRIEGMPVKVDSACHSSLIIGFEAPAGSFSYNKAKEKYDYYTDKMYFWVNDPLLYSRKCKKISVDDFIKIMHMNFFMPEMCYVCYTSDKPVFAAQTLQTIHLPGSRKIELVADNSKTISRTNIDFLDKEIIKFIPGDAGISSLSDILMYDIPIFNNSSNNDVYVKCTISNSSTVIISEKSSLVTNSAIINEFTIPENPSMNEFYFNFINANLVKKFNDELIKLNITDENEYTFIVELMDANTNTKLDSFDIKFKYTLSKEKKLFLKPEKDMINLNKTCPIQLTYGIDETSAIDVSKVANWSVASGSIDTSSTCLYRPSTTGEFKISATLKKDTVLSDNSVVAADTTESFMIKVNGLFLSPLSCTKSAGEQSQFMLKYGINEQAANDVTNIASWSFEPSGNPPIDKGLFTAPDVAGKYQISANYDGMFATAEVTVAPLFEVVPNNVSINIGQSRQFTAVYKGNVIATGVQWVVLDGDGTISPTGYFTATCYQAGARRIKATYQNVSANAGIYITDDRIQLSITRPVNSAYAGVYCPEGDLFPNSATSFYVNASGLGVTSVEVSIGESPVKGTIVPGGYSPYKYAFTFVPAFRASLGDADETYSVTVKCRENPNTSDSIEIVLRNPFLKQWTYYWRDYYWTPNGEFKTTDINLSRFKNTSEVYFLVTYTDGVSKSPHGPYTAYSNGYQRDYGAIPPVHPVSTTGNYYFGQKIGPWNNYAGDIKTDTLTRQEIYLPSLLEYTWQTFYTPTGAVTGQGRYKRTGPTSPYWTAYPY